MISKIRSSISHIVDVFYNKYYPPQIIFRSKQRARLKNTHFSLFTGNCMGGYIYHQLGIQFTSPTINMMIENKDFVKLLLNLEYYMTLEPVPYVDPRFENVPSALLDDIILHFTHYRTVEEGIKSWNKRKSRIDFNNVYAILSDIDLNKEDIELLRNVKCKKLIVFTSKKYTYPYCLYLPEFKNSKNVGPLIGKTISGKWQFEKFFDFVGWINSDDKESQNFYIGKGE